MEPVSGPCFFAEPFMYRRLLRVFRFVTISALAFYSVVPAFPQSGANSLKFVRVFSSADDIKREHTVLNRTLDIVAGPADPTSHADALKSPAAIATDSAHRIFVADPGANTVHIFDLEHGRYSHLAGTAERFHDPIDLALDGRDNLYVVDQIGRAIFVYDRAGKYRRSLGALRGGESYFEGPTGIAIDRAAGRIYVCDRLAQMIFVMDLRGKILRRIGKRGGGEGPGEFRLPSKVALSGNELYVLDSGNKRIEVVDTTGKFLRAMPVGYAGHGTGLAVDTQHNAYITDPSINQIQVFGTDGRSLRFLDITSVQGGNFGSPSAMWIDAPNTLYVIDSQKNQVGEFELQQ